MIMYKNFNYYLLSFMLLFVWNCASGPSSIEFTSAKTKARSERNLKDAETYALKAIENPIHANDAQVPYFLAMEIYKQQKKWDLVYNMLEEAMNRDPNAMLERRFVHKEKVITQMSDAIDIFYKNELWYIMFNDAITAVNNEDKSKAIELLLLSIKLDSLNVKSYVLLSKVYKLNNQSELSLEAIDQALKFDSLNSEQKAELYLVKAEIYKENDDYNNAIKYSELAYNQTNSIYAIIELLSLNLLAEEFFKAIEWGNIVYEELYQVDQAFVPNVIFNIGLAYRYVATYHYDLGVNIIDRLNNNEQVSRSELEDCKNNFDIALEHFDLSRDYFLESHDEQMSDVEDEYDTDASIRADQTKDYMKQIKKTLLPFIEKEITNLNIGILE